MGGTGGTIACVPFTVGGCSEGCDAGDGGVREVRGA
jgi:hypothetical protein